jgi:hypothetical protein
MKTTKKIVLTLIIALITIVVISSASTVYGFDVFREQASQMISGSYYLPNNVIGGGTLFCINPGGEFHVSDMLSSGENSMFYVGMTTPSHYACEEEEPNLEAPWSNNSRFYYRYTAGENFSWSQYPDAAYVLAEMQERGELTSWESAYGIWNSRISNPKRVGNYEIIGESQAYDTFYQTIHGGYTTNDVFNTVVVDKTSGVKNVVNQTEGTYTVGPFVIDYPDGYYNGTNKFSWINSIVAVTDKGDLPVTILNKAGEEINIADLGKNGTKTLDNVEFYIKFTSTEATQMTLKVEFGYLERCEATMTQYNGVKIYRNWATEYGSMCDHSYDESYEYEDGGYYVSCEHGGIHPLGDWESKTVSGTRRVELYYATRRFRAYDSQDGASQTLMLASNIAKVDKTTTLYFTGATIIKPDLKTLKPTAEGTPSNPNAINLTMQLAGTVFIDQDTGKVNEGNNKLDSDEGLAGVEVYLHQVGGNVVAKTLTDASGNYIFKDVNAQKQYYIEFVYNGILYTNVERLSGNAVDISKATEEAQGHSGNRQSFNSQFTEIGSYPQNYNGRKVYLQEEIADTFKTIAQNYGAHGSDEMSLFANDCRISAYTTETYPLTSIFVIDKFESIVAGKNYSAIYKTGGTYDQMHINLGIKSRPTFDLALYKDVYNAVVEINGKTETYTYDARRDWDNNGFSFGVSEDDYLTQLRSKYISGASTNLTTRTTIDEGSYTTEFRTEEIVNGNNNNTAINNTNLYDENKNYAWTDINNNLSDSDKLKIHVTYKIAIRNQSSVVGAVTEIVDYYDSNYQFEDAYVGDENGTKTAGVTASTTSKYGEATRIASENGTWTTSTGAGEYKTIYLVPTEQSLSNGETQYVYVTFGLIDPETTLINAGLPDGNSLYTYNLAEINGYTTYGEGLIDRDSNPGNFDPSTYVMGQTALEDDESKAPAFIYSHRTSRTLEGTVFEDAVTSNNSDKINTDKTRFGNGTIDSTDKTIQGVKVELVEIKDTNNDGVKELISRQTTYTDENGWYGFGAFVPGDYVIRYTYGADDNTALTTYSQYVQGINDTSYNGQDYQSTTYTTGSQELTSTKYVVDDVLSGIYDTNNNERNTEENPVNIDTQKYSINGNIVEYKVQNISKYSDGYYWYADTTIANKSDATDDASRRAQVTAYSNEEYGTGIINHKAEVFNSYINQATLRDQESKDNNFDEYTQAQPMDASVDTQAKNRELVNELERRTYMYAYTAEIPVEVEYTTQQITGSQPTDKYTYKITGVDFGVVERAKSQLTIDQDIAYVKVTATDGTTILELSNNDDGTVTVITGTDYNWPAKGKTSTYDKNEKLDVILDDELLSGAKLEVTYKITVTNNSEQDSDATTRAATIINYVANNLNFDLNDNNGLWEVVKKSDIQTELYSSYINNETNSVTNTKLVDLSTQTTVLKATDTNPLVSTALKPGQSVTSTLTLKKTLSAESSTDDLSYSNLTEIVEIDNTVGRYDRGAIPGNQSLEEQPREHDTSGASRYDETDQDSGTKNVKTRYPEDGRIIVTPPTGSTQIYYVLGATVALILAAGIFIIKKFVIGKKK